MVIALAFPLWRGEFKTCLRLQLMKSWFHTFCLVQLSELALKGLGLGWQMCGRSVLRCKSCGRETPPQVFGISVPWYIYNQRVSGIFKREQPKKNMAFCCCTSMRDCCGCRKSRKLPPLTQTFVPETPWSKIAEQDELSEPENAQ